VQLIQFTLRRGPTDQTEMSSDRKRTSMIAVVAINRGVVHRAPSPVIDVTAAPLASANTATENATSARRRARRTDRLVDDARKETLSSLSVNRNQSSARRADSLPSTSWRPTRNCWCLETPTTTDGILV